MKKRDYLLSSSGMIFLAAVLVVGLIAACGSDSKTSTSTPSGPAVTAITTTAGAAQAASAGVASVSGISNIGVSLSGMVSSSPAPGMKGKAFAKKAAAMRKAMQAPRMETITEPCEDGGSETSTFSGDQTAFSATMTATNCKEDGEISNGTMSITSSGAGATMSISMNGTSTSYLQDLSNSAYEYTTPIMIENYTNFSISMTTTQTSQVSMTANGSMVSEDLTANPKVKEESAFTNLSLTMNESTGSMSMKGGMSNKTSEDSGSGYKVVAVDSFTNFDFSVSSTSTGITTMNLNGTIETVSTPKECTDGVYTFKTITPVVSDANGNPTSGKISVNDTVFVEFTSSGTKVSLDGGKTYSTVDLASICPATM